MKHIYIFLLLGVRRHNLNYYTLHGGRLLLFISAIGGAAFTDFFRAFLPNYDVQTHAEYATENALLYFIYLQLFIRVQELPRCFPM